MTIRLGPDRWRRLPAGRTYPLHRLPDSPVLRGTKLWPSAGGLGSTVFSARPGT